MAKRRDIVCSVYAAAKMRSLRMVISRSKDIASKWYSFKQSGICFWQCRGFCNGSQQPYFITTPIFYVNAEPHIGHAYTAILADAAARFHVLLDHNPVIFSTGTDEHGLKIQQSASHAKKDPKLFCDDISKTFLQAMQLCEIGFTDFIRTTENRHVTNVQQFWEILAKKEFIYHGKYEGWYCTADETYVPEEHTTISQLPDGRQQRISVESGRPVEWSCEENYMFKLSSCREDLQRWLNSGSVIRPQRYYNLVKSWLDDELPDLSVSRPSARLSWGIPVPGDTSQTMYVWLDALLNYLTVAKSADPNLTWPPSVHVIGKDILKFHALYWPAFLIAAGIEPPKSLLVHGHWLVDDIKMSKTTGNVISPKTCTDVATASGLRYFLLHEGVPSNDGNFTIKMMMRIANTDLADGIGNLVNRCCGKSLNPSQKRPAVDRTSFESCGQVGSDLLELLLRTPDIVYKDFKEWHFHKGIDQIMALVRGANGFFQTMEPWQLKAKGEIDKLNATTAATMEIARVVGILLQPIVPSFSERMLNKLGVPKGERNWEFAQFRPNSLEYPIEKQKEVLFPRIKAV